MHPNTVSSEIHFHIHWVSSNKVDWERHGTQAEAEESAKQLAARGEEYTVEQFDEACSKCRTVASSARQ